jgi:hypothetical protein
VVGPAPKKNVLPSPIAPIFESISSQWRGIDCSSLLILDFDLSPKNSMGSFKISLNTYNNFLLLENFLFS